MNNKGIFLALGLSLVLLALVGCTRSATTALPPTPTLAAPETLGGGFPTPVGGRPGAGAGAMNAPTATAAAVATMMMQTLGPEAGGGAVDTPTSIPAGGTTPTPKPQPPTATPVPTTAGIPTITVPSSYTLHKGEYPYCLARRFNIDPNTLLAVNGLSRGQVVYPGTVLTIPQNAPPFPGNRAWHPHPDTYTVRVGDTIYSIACYYGDVSPEAIAAANGISVNTPLTPGQTLHIP
ncbi:MAG TPA: LysM peptidoglycan-binding domain-containing protein [Anaerolineae bacterium]|nr:LysM peptidoglycan-binding domain-containing protein [Anaerolineae bacterium]HID84756.1 LysM peptidoglycan-binding domain-containing protein [Anaerolineales bacterium]HIQ09810.1 LysM peptidoglycan-binding domain-containing protein [Anaerolineaceae bacterium]